MGVETKSQDTRLVHLKVDKACNIVRFGQIVCEAKAGVDNTFQLPTGTHFLDLVSNNGETKRLFVEVNFAQKEVVIDERTNKSEPIGTMPNPTGKTPSFIKPSFEVKNWGVLLFFAIVFGLAYLILNYEPKERVKVLSSITTEGEDDGNVTFEYDSLARLRRISDTQGYENLYIMHSMNQILFGKQTDNLDGHYAKGTDSGTWGYNDSDFRVWNGMVTNIHRYCYYAKSNDMNFIWSKLGNLKTMNKNFSLGYLENSSSLLKNKLGFDFGLFVFSRKFYCDIKQMVFLDTAMFKKSENLPITVKWHYSDTNMNITEYHSATLDWDFDEDSLPIRVQIHDIYCGAKKNAPKHEKYYTYRFNWKEMEISKSSQGAEESPDFVNVPNNVIVSRIVGETASSDSDVAKEITADSEMQLIDLGLSVLWADRNLGATSPFDEGDLLGWGNNTSTLDKDLSRFPCKNAPSTIKGTKYDNAFSQLGGKWRMPTSDELNELKTKCIWSLMTDVEGTHYYKVTGPSGNCIYLPLPGYEVAGVRKYRNKFGFLWSSDIYAKNNQFAANLSYGLTLDDKHFGLSGFYRYAGESVRPVQKKYRLKDL